MNGRLFSLRIALGVFLAAAGQVAATGPIVITEIMFDSYSSAMLSGGAFEYIEIQNISEAPVDLAPFSIDGGVGFFLGVIPPGPLRILDPGEIGLIVANAAAMESRYGPGLPILGEYNSGLNNDGEGLLFITFGPTQTIWHQFNFGLEAPWPQPRRLGGGYPIELVSPWTNPDHALPESWRRNWSQAGTPGVVADTDRDGLDDSWEMYWFGNLVQTGAGDPDSDGKTNALERAAMSPPGSIRTIPVPDVAISEIMFDSYGEETEPGASFEYIELQNVSGHPVDLTGFSITAGIGFSFPAGTSLATGEIAIVAANPAAFALRYGPGPRVLGMFTGRLSNSGDDIVLLSPSGEEVFVVPYRLDDPWPRSPSPGEGGYPFDLIRPETRPNGEDPGSWRRHWLARGTPGEVSDGDGDSLDDAWEMEFFGTTATGFADDPDGDGKTNGQERAALTDPNENAVAARQIAITEIMFDSFGEGDVPGGLYEYIEFQNVSGEPVDLAGWKVGDAFQFTFGPRVLAPGEMLLVVKSLAHFRARYGPAPPVAGVYLDSLSNDGEKITLRDAQGRAVQRFAFSISPPWPLSPDPDSGGYPLELIAPWTSPDQSDPVNWRRSWLARGTPGQPFDQDGDMLEDVWEMEFFGNLSHSASEDTDGDGLDNAGERARLTRPNDPDSDDDGLPDRVESSTGTVAGPDNTGTNPRVADADLDGLMDGGEITAGSSPFDPDSDDDGVPDGPEVRYGGNPLDPAILPAAPVIDLFAPDRLVIHEGETFRLDWRVRNMQGVSISPGFDGAQPAEGSRVIYPLRDVMLVASGLADFTEWRYRDTGVTPPPGWNGPAFADSAWPAGIASFAGGSTRFVSEVARPNTLLAYSPTGPVTYYFRHAFDLAQPVTGHHQRVFLTCKDSGVVYLDGIEIVRHRFGQGTILPNQRGIPGASGVWPPDSYPLGGVLPRPGRNVLAVEMHAAPPGGDAEGVAFDLALVNSVPATGSLTYQLRAQNPFGSTSRQFVLEITAPPGPAVTYAAWAGTRFSPPQLADPAVSGPGADADVDEASNLLEFLSGTSPVSRGSFPSPEISPAPGGAGMLISWRRIRLPQGAQLTLEYAAGLAEWKAFDDAGLPQVADLLTLNSIRDNGDGTETVTALLAPPARRIFLRLHATAAP